MNRCIEKVADGRHHRRGAGPGPGAAAGRRAGRAVARWRRSTGSTPSRRVAARRGRGADGQPGLARPGGLPAGPAGTAPARRAATPAVRSTGSMCPAPGNTVSWADGQRLGDPPGHRHRGEPVAGARQHDRRRVARRRRARRPARGRPASAGSPRSCPADSPATAATVIRRASASACGPSSSQRSPGPSTRGWPSAGRASHRASNTRSSRARRRRRRAAEARACGPRARPRPSRPARSPAPARPRRGAARPAP